MYFGESWVHRCLIVKLEDLMFASHKLNTARVMSRLNTL